MDNSEKIKKLQDELDELNIDKVRAKRKKIKDELNILQDEENNKLNEEIKQIFQKYSVNFVYLDGPYCNRWVREYKINPISYILYQNDNFFISQKFSYGRTISCFSELSPECFDLLKNDIIRECEKYRVVLFLKYAFQKNDKEMIDVVIRYFREYNEEYNLDIEGKDDYYYVMSNDDFGKNLCDYYANFEKLSITHNPIDSEWLFVSSLCGDVNYKCYGSLHMMYVTPITFSRKKKSDGDYFVCDCDGLCRMTERIAKAKDDDTPEMRFKNKMLNIIKERKLDI